MILPQRKIHRLVFLALAILIPVVLVSAWRARQAPATMDAIPGRLFPPMPPNSEGKR